jgi:hypothetical protein
VRLTRRRALAAGAAAAAAPPAVLAAVAQADQSSQTILASLSSALTLELTAVESYDFFLASGVLSARTRAPVRRCRDQDLAHVHRLRVVIERLGGISPHAPDPATIPSLTDATTESAALDFATALEEQTVGAYMATMRMIYRRPLVRTVGSLMASDAQQLVVLRQLGGTPPVPSPFEQGSPP